MPLFDRGGRGDIGDESYILAKATTDAVLFRRGGGYVADTTITATQTLRLPISTTIPQPLGRPDQLTIGRYGVTFSSPTWTDSSTRSRGNRALRAGIQQSAIAGWRSSAFLFEFPSRSSSTPRAIHRPLPASLRRG
jgi:hypothetical protein